MRIKIFNWLQTTICGLNTTLRKFRKKSDHKRWEKEQNLSQSWDSRTEKIAKLVTARKSVIEFGAGRLVLKNLLPEGCTYTPSDLVKRSPETIIWDLNSKTFIKIKPYDIAIFSGVLEYVYDVPNLILHLSNYVNEIIVSYAVTTDKNKINRRKNGWVNDYNSEEFIEIFENAGFRCNHQEKWQSQYIYRFINVRPPDLERLLRYQFVK